MQDLINDLLNYLFGCHHPANSLSLPITLPDEVTGIKHTYQTCTKCTQRVYIDNTNLEHMSAAATRRMFAAELAQQEDRHVLIDLTQHDLVRVR